MEFKKDEQVIVNPLRIKQWIIDELEASIILYYTGASRESAKIIDEQKKNTTSKNPIAIEAMHRIKQSSIDMKEAILMGDITEFAKILGKGWEDKKRMASSISNSHIDDIFKTAMDAGATTGKISGAGGGGFIIFVVDPVKRIDVINALSWLDGRVVDFQFSKGGCHGWRVYKRL